MDTANFCNGIFQLCAPSAPSSLTLDFATRKCSCSNQQRKVSLSGLWTNGSHARFQVCVESRSESDLHRIGGSLSWQLAWLKLAGMNSAPKLITTSAHWRALRITRKTHKSKQHVWGFYPQIHAANQTHWNHERGTRWDLIWNRCKILSSRKP